MSSSVSGLFSKKTKKRLEGAVGLGKVVAERNPIAHGLLTAKETADSAHKLLYGKDPRYLPSSIPKKFRAPPKRYRPSRKKANHLCQETRRWNGCQRKTRSRGCIAKLATHD